MRERKRHLLEIKRHLLDDAEELALVRLQGVHHAFCGRLQPLLGTRHGAGAGAAGVSHRSHACAHPCSTAGLAVLSDRDKVCNGRRATALPPPCTGTLGGRWARAWRKTKRCHAHPIAQPGGEHLPRQSTPIMCAQPGSVRVVCTRVRARVEPGATTGAREYTGSSSLTFPAPAHNHAELSGGNRHSAPCADVLGVTHRLPPLALDLCTGAASVSARRRSPVSAADPTARGVAASRASRKKDKNIIFFLHIARGKGGLWQVSEAPKYFWGTNQG
jgi:hypothetical protein